MKLPSIFTKAFGKVSEKMAPIAMKASAHSPEILLTVGIVGVVGGCVYACYQTTKINDTVEPHLDSIEQAKEEMQEEMVSPKEYKTKITKEYAYAIGSVAKLYALPTAVVGLSLACICKSHNILMGRYLGAVSAYNAVTEAFDAYRKRVEERYGKDEEEDIYYGRKRVLTDSTIKGKNGKEKTVQIETTEQTDPHNPYMKFFGPDYSDEATGDPSHDLFTLKRIERNANSLLITRGHVFLNEILEQLGFEHTKEGAIVGWIRGEGDPINFGLEDPSINGRFVDGMEENALIRFNVQGIIYDKI